MAVAGKTGALRGTRNTAFSAQNYSGVILGNSATGTNGITVALPLYDAVETNANMSTMTKERDSGSSLVRAKKILSSGTFAYNAAVNSTYVISRITTTLAGVAKTNLLFMGAGTRSKPIHDFIHDFGVKYLTAWVSGRFSWTGKLSTGATKNSRQMWLSADGTSVSAPTTLSATFMKDLRDGNASDKAVDDTVNVSRAIPGELVMKVDFVNKSLSGGDFFDYKAITGM